MEMNLLVRNQMMPGALPCGHYSPGLDVPKLTEGKEQMCGAKHVGKNNGGQGQITRS